MTFVGSERKVIKSMGAADNYLARGFPGGSPLDKLFSIQQEKQIIYEGEKRG